jgi:hypothetical protein
MVGAGVIALVLGVLLMVLASRAAARRRATPAVMLSAWLLAFLGVVLLVLGLLS